MSRGEDESVEKEAKRALSATAGSPAPTAGESIPTGHAAPARWSLHVGPGDPRDNAQQPTSTCSHTTPLIGGRPAAIVVRIEIRWVASFVMRGASHGGLGVVEVWASVNTV